MQTKFQFGLAVLGLGLGLAGLGAGVAAPPGPEAGGACPPPPSGMMPGFGPPGMMSGFGPPGMMSGFGPPGRGPGDVPGFGRFGPPGRGPAEWPDAPPAPRLICAEGVHHGAAALGDMRSRLRLTAEQVPAWDAVARASETADAAMLALCDTLPDRFAPPTTPQRMAFLEQALGLGRDRLAALRPIVEALYATLSPAQRATLDTMPMLLDGR